MASEARVDSSAATADVESLIIRSIFGQGASDQNGEHAKAFQNEGTT